MFGCMISMLLSNAVAMILIILLVKGIISEIFIFGLIVLYMVIVGATILLMSNID